MTVEEAIAAAEVLLPGHEAPALDPRWQAIIAVGGIRRDGARGVLRRFPYFLVYRVEPERVVIVAVAHAHQRPGYWKDRVMTPGQPPNEADAPDRPRDGVAVARGSSGSV